MPPLVFRFSTHSAESNASKLRSSLDAERGWAAALKVGGSNASPTQKGGNWEHEQAIATAHQTKA